MPIAQLAPAANEPAQALLLIEKLPLVMNVPMESGAVPVFESVTACGALVVPTAWLAKLRLATERLATGAVPVALRLTGLRAAAGAAAIIGKRKRAADRSGGGWSEGHRFGATGAHGQR
jgi:hypothetical protein